MKLLDNVEETYATKVKREAGRLFSVCAQSAKASFDDFWYAKGPRKELKSKQVLQAQFDEMGVLAVEVMSQHAAVQTFLYGLNPGSVENPRGWIPLYAPYEYTANEDGTITLGELANVGVI